MVRSSTEGPGEGTSLRGHRCDRGRTRYPLHPPERGLVPLSASGAGGHEARGAHASLRHAYAASSRASPSSPFSSSVSSSSATPWRACGGRLMPAPGPLPPETRCENMRSTISDLVAATALVLGTPAVLAAQQMGSQSLRPYWHVFIAYAIRHHSGDGLGGLHRPSPLPPRGNASASEVPARRSGRCRRGGDVRRHGPGVLPLSAQTTTMPSTLRYGSGLLDVPVASVLAHGQLTATGVWASSPAWTDASPSTTPGSRRVRRGRVSTSSFSDASLAVGLFDRVEAGLSFQAFGDEASGGDIWGLFGRVELWEPVDQGVGLALGGRWLGSPDFGDGVEYRPGRLGFADERIRAEYTDLRGARTNLSLYGVATGLPPRLRRGPPPRKRHHDHARARKRDVRQPWRARFLLAWALERMVPRVGAARGGLGPVDAHVDGRAQRLRRERRRAARLRWLPRGGARFSRRTTSGRAPGRRRST